MRGRAKRQRRGAVSPAGAKFAIGGRGGTHQKRARSLHKGQRKARKGAGVDSEAAEIAGDGEWDREKNPWEGEARGH